MSRTAIVALVFLAHAPGAAWGQVSSAKGKSADSACLPMYERAENLSATLLATRQHYSRWRSEQPVVRDAAEFGPWLATPSLPIAAAEQVVQPARGVDRAARLPNGQSLWSPREQLVDGKPVQFVGGSGDTAVYLTRDVKASRPVTITVGIGGGDHLDVWLNGRRVASADTHLTSGRYGCSYRVDGTRVDQVIVALDLDAGGNTLLVRLVPGSEQSFFFSPSPRPVPRIWERVRRDFPASQNPLLELAHADWFRDDGWLAATDHKFEEQLIERLAADCGRQQELIQKELHALSSGEACRDDRLWLDLCVKTSVLAKLNGELGRLRAAVNHLGRAYPDDYPADALCDDLVQFEQRLATQAAAGLDPADEATRQLMAELPEMRRRMLVDLNPWLRDTEIVFVKRYTYDSKHYYDDFQHISRWGGNLCVYAPADGSVRELVPQLTGGVFDRYDLSFDARRIVFGYRRPQREGYRIYEVGVDGNGLRQVTFPPPDEEQRIGKYGKTSTGDGFYGSMGYQFWTDDVHPCYLPDGGLCFASTRCEHGVLCTPNHYLACTNLFRMNPDGTGLRAISQGALSEFTPTMMEDGRILYNRWEYVYKGIAAIQPLWTTRPDGSGSEEFYGDNITNPGVLWQARQVPGHPQLAVCIGCGHEPMGIGQVLLLDMTRDKRTTEPMISLTPNVKTQNLRGLYQLRNGVWREDIYGPFYADPYPLSDKFFLVSCNPDRRYNDPAAYGIHLLDAFGNRVPIYSDPEISCWQPMLLRARKVPPVLPAIASVEESPVEESPMEEPPGEESSTATVFLSDVYRGLEGVPPGTVKYVRVMEQIPKPWAAEVDPLRGEDRGADGFGGHIAVSHNAHIWIAVLRGIVPVEDDGSACFEVPANRNLFFQALDENFMEVQRMRTFVNFEPGESRSCIGCHEHRTQAPVSRLATAFGRLPAQLAAQPGEVAPRPLDYASDVQPIFDRHCVSCHVGKNPDVKGSAEPDLRGDLTTMFNRSYENIMRAGLVDTIREWAGMTYSMQNAEAVPPYSHGSHCSRLVEVLRGEDGTGHYDVELSREEWTKLVTWIDCGAPYYGSYYGRRNLAYRGQPDFRPVPTVESACGMPPDFPDLPKAEPLPAELLAWWPLSEGQDRTATDASGNGHNGEIWGAEWVQDETRGRVLSFDGNDYVAVDGLRQQEAISVSLWVKPNSLPNRWSPLLFTDSGTRGAFHFSLNEDGTPNVAINYGPQPWAHRRATTRFATGKWRHLAVTCDPRFGGGIVFYVDGKPGTERRLGLSVPLDLTSFRLGAWKGWEGTPGRGFHGLLHDVRLYRGLLTAEQVAGLYGSGKTPD